MPKLHYRSKSTAGKKNNNTHLLHINNHDARPNITVGFKLMHEEGDTWKTTAHYYVFGHSCC